MILASLQEKSVNQEKSVKSIAQHEHTNKNQKRRLTKHSELNDNEATYKSVEIKCEKCLKTLNLLNESLCLSIDSTSYHTDLSH